METYEKNKNSPSILTTIGIITGVIGVALALVVAAVTANNSISQENKKIADMLVEFRIEMKDDLNIIKGDITEIKRDIVEMKSDIREIKSDIKIIESRLDEHDTRLVELEDN